MENQPTKPKASKKIPNSYQDNVFEVWKIFWKAGYAYKHTGKDEHFYARVLEDVMNLPLEEFLEKYGD